MIKTVLFDLDGTLLDTAPDLAWCLNCVLTEYARPNLTFERIRPVVSHGGAALIKLGFGLTDADPGYGERRQRLLDLYRDNLSRETRPFPGMDELLQALDEAGLQWGVVTNKPAWLTDPLLQALGLYERAAVVVSGDSLPQRKPHPAPILHACESTDSQAHECIYVGDAERDIESGRRAGVHTLVALFGYIGPDEQPEAWQADALVASPAEILDWITRFNRTAASG